MTQNTLTFILTSLANPLISHCSSPLWTEKTLPWLNPSWSNFSMISPGLLDDYFNHLSSIFTDN